MLIDFLYIKFLIWIFVGGLFLSKLTKRRKEIVLGSTKERWPPAVAILFVAPLIFWCATRNRGYGDTWAYYQNFLEAPGTFSGVIPYAKTFPKDQWFFAILAFGKALFGSNEDFTFGLIACIQLLIIALIYRKYSRDFWLSIFLFVASTDYTAWMFNGMRQFFAATIGFVAFPFILKKKYIPAILIILLASRFHMSAILILPVVFLAQGKAWNKRTLLASLFTFVVIAYIDEFTGFLDNFLQDSQYKNIVPDWESSQDDGTNGIRVLVYSVPAILAFVYRKKLEDVESPMIHLCVNMSVAAAAIYLISMFTSGILIGRLPIYCSLYNYILLPWEVRHFFKKESRLFITISLILFYIAFYLYSYM